MIPQHIAGTTGHVCYWLAVPNLSANIQFVSAVLLLTFASFN